MLPVWEYKAAIGVGLHLGVSQHVVVAAGVRALLTQTRREQAAFVRDVREEKLPLPRPRLWYCWYCRFRDWFRYRR